MRSPNSFQAQQGYLTFAQNTADVDYLELAYYQAASIKQTQQINQYAVAVDTATRQLITDRHLQVFDHVVDIVDPDPWAMSNEWQAWHITPFKETIKLESDILFPQNIDHWWTGMRQQELCFTSKIRNYEGQVSADRHYRRVFDDNNLPDIYTGMYYFRFGQASMQFFALVQQVYENWAMYRDQVLKNCREDQPTTDVAFAVAALLFGAERCMIPALDYPSFVHMKGAINNLASTADWRDAYFAQLDGVQISIGFTKQQWPVHYYQKDFVNDQFRAQLLRGLEQLSATQD